MGCVAIVIVISMMIYASVLQQKVFMLSSLTRAYVFHHRCHYNLRLKNRKLCVEIQLRVRNTHSHTQYRQNVCVEITLFKMMACKFNKVLFI